MGLGIRMRSTWIPRSLHPDQLLCLMDQLTCKFFLTLFHSFNKFSNSVKFAVQYNDVDVASMLLQRGAVNETDVLEEAIFDCNVEIVTILLESGADVHAEVDFGGGPTPIYEWCAQYLQFEEENANYSSVHELERLKKINKLVMEKKKKWGEKKKKKKKKKS